MDISKITPNLIQGLEQKQTEQLQALSRVLNLVIGKNQVATVLATQPVSKPEREAMLKQTTQALAQLQKQQAANPAAVTPALKAEISRLTQQQQLLQSPNLKWVDLMVNNRQLATYSDRPLTPGQPLVIQLQGPQKLVLVDDAPAEALLKTAMTAIQTAAAIKAGIAVSNTTQDAKTQPNLALPLAQQVANAANSQAMSQVKLTGSLVTVTNAAAQTVPVPPASHGHLPDLSETALHEQLPVVQQRDTRPSIPFSPQELAKKFSTETQPLRQDPANQPAKQLVSDNLRRLLPHKDAPEQLFAAIQQLQRMPEARRQQLLPATVEQALKSLATRLRTPAQLSEPKQLAQAVKDSGIFFERKLQQWAPSARSPHAEQHSGAADAKATSKQSNVQANNSLAPRITQDAKGALLNLLNKTSQELTGKPLTSEQTYKLVQQPLSPPSSSGTAATAPSGQKSELAQALAIFIRDLINRPTKTGAAKEIRTQLLGLIQQQSQHSLAKIQLQQLQAIHQELESRETGSQSSSWQLEIPLRHQSEVQQLQLHIARDWVEENHEGEAGKAGTTKIRQWSVTLRFDLPTLGEFCAQLAVAGEQVNATLWASRENTFEQARQQLDSLRHQLEEEGIEVKSLQCLHGMPPPKPFALSYSLIDIST